MCTVRLWSLNMQHKTLLYYYEDMQLYRKRQSLTSLWCKTEVCRLHYIFFHSVFGILTPFYFLFYNILHLHNHLFIFMFYFWCFLPIICDVSCEPLPLSILWKLCRFWPTYLLFNNVIFNWTFFVFQLILKMCANILNWRLFFFFWSALYYCHL